MKILSKQKYWGMVDKINELEKVNKELNKKITDKEFNYLKEYERYRDKAEKLEEVNKYHQKLIEIRDSDFAQLSQKYKEITGAKGGYVARINSLTKKLNEKEKEIEKLKSDRYLIVKPNTKNRKHLQKMQIRTKSKNSDIIKKVMES